MGTKTHLAIKTPPFYEKSKKIILELAKDLISVEYNAIAFEKEKNCSWYSFTQVMCLPVFNLRRCCIHFTQVQEICCIHFTQVAVSFFRRWYNKPVVFLRRLEI